MMNKEHELITVKEFANRKGITEQAVYKSKKFRNFFVKQNNLTLIDFTAFTASDNQPNNQYFNQRTTNEQPTVESPIVAVLATLQEQLKEKDRQIERLQAELTETRQTAGAEKEKLLMLLEREQETNRNNQVLIAKAQEKIALPPERKGFFGRWKNREGEDTQE